MPFLTERKLPESYLLLTMACLRGGYWTTLDNAQHDNIAALRKKLPQDLERYVKSWIGDLRCKKSSDGPTVDVRMCPRSHAKLCIHHNAVLRRNGWIYLFGISMHLQTHTCTNVRMYVVPLSARARICTHVCTYVSMYMYMYTYTYTYMYTYRCMYMYTCV